MDQLLHLRRILLALPLAKNRLLIRLDYRQVRLTRRDPPSSLTLEAVRLTLMSHQNRRYH